MSNVFVNLPVLTSNGNGASVDVSTMAATKTIIVGGSFLATVTIEYSTAPSGDFWAPVPNGSFVNGSGRVVVELAAQRMRAVTSGYKSGAPNADVGAPYSPGSFLQLTGIAGSIATMPPFKTVLAGGSCNVEISEDNVSFSQVFSFQGPGAQSGIIVGQFARVTNGVTCWMGAAAPSIDSEPSNGSLAIEATARLFPDPFGVKVDVISQSGQFVGPGAYNGVGTYQIQMIQIPGITAASQAIIQITPVTSAPIMAVVIGSFIVDHIQLGIRVFSNAGVPIDSGLYVHVDFLAP